MLLTSSVQFSEPKVGLHTQEGVNWQLSQIHKPVLLETYQLSALWLLFHPEFQTVTFHII